MPAVEVRTLRVSAEMDASKYAAGAREVADAGNQMAAAHRAVGSSVSDSQQKISQAGSVYERLSRQFIDGYASAQRFNQAINTLTRGIELGRIEMTQASAILDGIYRKYGMMADAARIAERGQVELSKAVQQANARFEEQGKIVPANQNRSGGNFAATNVAYQAQDVLVQAAGGASIGTIALQQGPQLAMALGEQGAAGAAKTLATGLASLVSPVNLVAIGLTAAAAAGVQYFSSILNKGEQSAKVLEKQRDLISEVTRKWGDALPSLKAYADEQDRLADASKRSQATGAFASQQWADLRKQIDPLTISFADLVSMLTVASAETTSVTQLQRDFSRLQNGISSGTANAQQAKTVQAELFTLFNETGIPALKEYAEQLNSVADGISRASDAAGMAKQQNALLDFTKNLPPLGILNPPISADGRIIIDPIEQQNQRAIDAANRNPTITSNGREVVVPIPMARPNIEMEGLPGEDRAGRSAAESYRDLIKSANDRIEQMKLEASVAGETGIAAEKMRMQLDLLQQAQDKGRTVTAAQRTEIEKLAEAYGRAATEAAKVRLNADLRFEREQLFRSSGDQEIASRLRGSGLPVDLNSQEAQIMRDNMRIEELRTGVKGFFTDFRDGLTQGDSFGKALGDAVINALTNAVNKMSERWIDQLVNSLLGGVSGGGLLSNVGVGSIASNDNFAANTTLGRLLGANDNIGKAGDIASYAAAIKSIESSGNYSALGPVTRTGDRAYGAYQVMGANVGPWTKQALGYSLSPSRFLANPAAQDAVFENRFGGYVGKYGASGAAQAWFGGPGSVGRGSSWADQLGTSGTEYVDKFNASLTRLSGTTDSATGGLQNFNPAVGSATQNLGTFGNGLGQLGNTLSSGATAGGGNSGGGLWGWLTSQFGGGSSTVGSASSAFNVRGYASGTDFAPGGVAMVGEGGRELVNLPRGSQVIPNHRTEAMLSGAGGGSPTTVIFKPNIINNNGSNVRTERRDTNDGPQFDIIIDEAVANNMSTPGSRSRRAVKSQFGLSEGLARR